MPAPPSGASHEHRTGGERTAVAPVLRDHHAYRTMGGDDMKLTPAQQSARIAILQEIERRGGSAMWSQLHSKGHHYGQVQATATRGDTKRVGVYCYVLTDVGRAALDPKP